MRYSPSTGVFYPEILNYPRLPSDIVTVPDNEATQAQNALIGSTIVYKAGHLIITPPTTVSSPAN